MRKGNHFFEILEILMCQTDPDWGGAVHVALMLTAWTPSLQSPNSVAQTLRAAHGYGPDAPD